jgi:hypothetical protein
VRLPAILHWEFNHFVVLQRVRRDGKAVIVDPATGERIVDVAELGKRFTGVALEVSAAPGFTKRRERSSLSIWSLFTFRGRPAEDLLSLKAIPMSRYVRFEDYPYVGPAIDAVRLEAKRSRAELGFSQLRLVVCFLHWHDIKEAPEERINSPLLLLPVDIDKKRGGQSAMPETLGVSLKKQDLRNLIEFLASLKDPPAEQAGGGGETKG